jgi:hypothetical protein
VAGEAGGALFVFENTGSATNPVFVARTGSANPLDGQSAGARSGPALGDFDGDGDADLVAGGQAGGFSAWKNQSAHPLGTASEVTGGANPLNGFSVGSLSAPALGDIDGDGDLDLFAGERFGTFFYFRNTGSKTSPAFAAVTGAGNPMNGFDVGLYSAPALGDLDGDGELDLVSGERYGTVLYYRNSGSITAPLYVARTGSLNPFDGYRPGFVVGSHARRSRRRWRSRRAGQREQRRAPLPAQHGKCDGTGVRGDDGWRQSAGRCRHGQLSGARVRRLRR